jgi:polar amino acid transport system substrate-binding protein
MADRTAASDSVTGPRVAEVIRSGRLLVALFPCFMVTKDPASGELKGVALEIARALAKQLGLSVVATQYASPPKVTEELEAGRSDMALFGTDVRRSSAVEFTAPVMEADLTYMVPAGSDIHSISDADKNGTTIAVVRNHLMDYALEGKLVRAQRVYADTPDAAFKLLVEGKTSVLAGIRPGLFGYANRMTGAQVLDDRYAVNSIAIAVGRGRPDWLQVVGEFAEEAKRTGVVQNAIVRAGLKGVQVAP